MHGKPKIPDVEESVCTHLSTVAGGTRSPIASARSTSPSSTTSNDDFRSVKDFEAGPGVEKGDAHMGVTIRFMLYRSWLRWHLGYRKIPISQMRVALLVIITQLVTMVAITRYCPLPPNPIDVADAMLLIPLLLVPLEVIFLFLAQIPTGFVRLIYVLNFALGVCSIGYLTFSSIYYGYRGCSSNNEYSTTWQSQQILFE
ncbi:MAG: hypothetical protein KVP17_003452 [Porospora cf. gigantea B]|uniref:uncharacterized protein n=1 Tax=Porospora cf. gigantea B TaxID=2853592 RepID=UPI003571BCE6|nr:MAG: hypothetical protein KVP17_003452 [Porospora cf. gigantea B]